MTSSGAALAEAYHRQVVAPILDDRWPALPHAAGRLGTGSDVLGLDDETSRDHDWGLRLDLLVPVDLVADVDRHLAERLPEEFAGHPTRFALTWDPAVRHRVRVDDVAGFATSRLGVDPSAGLTTDDWLALTGQAVLEVTAGPVFIDTSGELSRLRARLAWYPPDLFRHPVAVDWVRLAQELPLVGRAGQLGDELGSRVIAARLVGVALHLGHLLERRWPPYAKWLGTSFARLPRAAAAARDLSEALAADEWCRREASLAAALASLHDLQREVGLPTGTDPLEPFWGRPFLGVREAVARALTDSIASASVRGLPRGVGSVDQWSDNVDLLLDRQGRGRSRPPGGR